MVLAAPTVLPYASAARRGLASGVIFMGVGAGVAASGTLAPLLLQEGLRETWFGFGALSLLLTAIAWSGWPTDAASTRVATPATPAHPPAARRVAGPLCRICVERGRLGAAHDLPCRLRCAWARRGRAGRRRVLGFIRNWSYRWSSPLWTPRRSRGKTAELRCDRRPPAIDSPVNRAQSSRQP